MPRPLLPIVAATLALIAACGPAPTPTPLYKRIIEASSNPGDLVLDPFAGCATTIIAAKELGRDGSALTAEPTPATTSSAAWLE